LNLSGAAFGENGLKRLADDPSLKDLRLDQCYIDSANARIFANSKLMNLDLRNNQISIEAITTLLTNPAFRSLDVQNNSERFLDQDNGGRLTYSARVEALAQAGDMATAQQRSLTDDETNAIVDEAVNALAIALGKNTKLETLRIGNSGLTISHLQSLISALENNTSLTTLDIGGDDITNEGILALAPALSKTKALKSLDVSSFVLGRKSKAKELADTVRRTKPNFNTIVDGVTY
jgi:Ran GTPase-activating protein (RanGAP) involved in mRNA processing and transport